MLFEDPAIHDMVAVPAPWLPVNPEVPAEMATIQSTPSLLNTLTVDGEIVEIVESVPLISGGAVTVFVTVVVRVGWVTVNVVVVGVVVTVFVFVSQQTKLVEVTVTVFASGDC